MLLCILSQRLFEKLSHRYSYFDLNCLLMYKYKLGYNCGVHNQRVYLNTGHISFIVQEIVKSHKLGNLGNKTTQLILD